MRLRRYINQTFGSTVPNSDLDYEDCKPYLIVQTQAKKACTELSVLYS